MAASVVDLPEPDGPKRTVIPGGASNATSSEKPPCARSTRDVDLERDRRAQSSRRTAVSLLTT